ncbi:MAG: hypothetical protein M1833_005627 [Piccolia ochrophora]|nr:MAG: hypothetical protein M1833_005627 [Piccolia ochrophora]
MRSLITAVYTLLSTALLTDAACECGYQLRDTRAYYTHRLANDFKNHTDAKDLNKVDEEFFRDWTVQSWTAKPTMQSPLSRTNREENVYIEDGKLVIKQEGFTEEDAAANRSVGIGAIVTKKDDFLHGSFRASFAVDRQPGAVAGFFTYENDTNEIDIEVLTKEPNATTIHYTNHPSLDPKGNPIVYSSAPVDLNTPWTEEQQHRFDWSEDNVTFYQDAEPMYATIVNIPRAPMSVQLNLWSSNSSWSGPPSTKDLAMRISSILIYHNTTDSDVGADSEFLEQCESAGGTAAEGTVCWDADPEVKVSAAAIGRYDDVTTAGWWVLGIGVLVSVLGGKVL